MSKLKSLPARLGFKPNKAPAVEPRVSLLQDVPIENLTSEDTSAVTAYWNQHTVCDLIFKSKEHSLDYLKERNAKYPLFPEFMNIWGDHQGEVVVDYGCGPGNDTVGFLVHSNAKQVIGIDVSPKALTLASHRLSLHRNADLRRVRLLKISDSEVAIPLPDNSVDYIYCEGVLHHTTDPLSIIKEFNRILKKGKEACVMVYNRHSLWMHLYVAYVEKILNGKYEKFNAEEAFARTTDGDHCPLSRCYRPADFLAFIQAAGFRGDYVGGYYSLLELDLFKKYGKKAAADERLPREHRQFLSNLTLDNNGYPLFDGKCTGVGGVYRLFKAD